MANRFARRLRIAAPVENVFDYVVDLERHGEWATNPLKVSVDSKPVTVGTTFSSEAKIGRTTRDSGRVTAFDRPYRFEFITEGSAGTVRNWFLLSEDGDGCVLEKGSHNTRLSLFSKCMIPVLAVIVPRMYDKNLHAIQARVDEARGAAAPDRTPRSTDTPARGEG